MSSNNILFIPGYSMDCNCYLIDDMLVDTGTGFNGEYLISQIEKHGVKKEDISLIVNTHCHFDHIGGNYLFEDAEIAVHELDAISMKNKDDLGTSMNAFENQNNSRVDIELKDGDEVGGFKVIHTPGHTRGGICLWDGVNLISGDTVFSNGGVGRFDIGGDLNDLMESVFKLTKLDVVNLLPGHGPIVEGNGKDHIKLSYSQF
ncbi:MBL fold metallo-hydrolase [uncultured Methanobrevibacter sp.]|uniref:MBL fold metallo-hydrolase n=1 Tax=uncultured Methanobrevibacter sp. TaxID=253161 RepID=UPI0025DB81EA|nr:MBL fold metallo-hydrolase [uncultured Methanobrevibacter sp.]